VSRDFLNLVFFIIHLLLVPLDTPRKDFKFFWIFEELFEFCKRLPGVFITGESSLPGVFITGELRLHGSEYTGEST
jgi:hypothetical protein